MKGQVNYFLVMTRGDSLHQSLSINTNKSRTCMFSPTRSDDHKSHKRSTTQPLRSTSKSAHGSVMSPLKASKVSSVLSNTHSNLGSVKRSSRHSGSTPSAKRSVWFLTSACAVIIYVTRCHLPLLNVFNFFINVFT